MKLRRSFKKAKETLFVFCSIAFSLQFLKVETISGKFFGLDIPDNINLSDVMLLLSFFIVFCLTNFLFLCLNYIHQCRWRIITSRLLYGDDIERYDRQKIRGDTDLSMWWEDTISSLRRVKEQADNNPTNADTNFSSQLSHFLTLANDGKVYKKFVLFEKWLFQLQVIQILNICIFQTALPLSFGTTSLIFCFYPNMDHYLYFLAGTLFVFLFFPFKDLIAHKINS